MASTQRVTISLSAGMGEEGDPAGGAEAAVVPGASGTQTEGLGVESTLRKSDALSVRRNFELKPHGRTRGNV